MRYWYVYLLLLSNPIFGQSVFTGRITDIGQTAIPNVNITLHSPHSAAILAFAITDKQGRYVISYQSTTDSLQLKAFGMGYAAQQKTVLNKAQETNFILTERYTDLKEVVVKEPPISRRGDTLSYSVSAFKTQSDRFIGDLIKRLPGIEVDANGKISYQGKPINKYYIEGLDLLNGRYSLANENLPVDAVSQVEVLENHQPIRMLDSLVFSENAALNIRFKNKITTTGTARLGLGGLPLLWEANVSPMLFTRGLQMIGSYQTNNIGNNVAKQIKTLTVEDILNPFENDNTKKNWVQAIPLATPSFSDSRWLNNNIYLGSVNFLKKLKQGYEFKANLSYLHDNQQQRGYTHTINYTPKDTINIFEDKYNRLIFNTFESNFVLLKNDKNKYFKNQLTFKSQWDEERGTLQRNGSPLSQGVESPFYSLTNHLKDIFKVKNQVLTFQSFLSLQNTPQSLTVAPMQFADLFGNQVAYDSLRQSVSQRSFFTHNMLSLNRYVKGFSVAPQIGFQIEKQNLDSQIERILGNKSAYVGNEFANELEWLKINYYVKLQTQYQKDKWRITVNTPLNWYNFRVQDKPLKQQETVNQLTFEPKISVKYDLNPFWELLGSIDRKNTFGEIENLFYGYMLRNYRTIERRNAPLSKNVSLSGNINIRYRNPLTSIFGYLTYSQRFTDNNLIYGTRLTTKGTSENYAIELFNTSKSQMIIVQAGKYIEPLKIQVNFDFQLMMSERQQIINGILTPVKTQNNSYGLKLNSKIAKWADIEYKFKKSDFQNQINDRKNEPTSQQQHQFNLNLYPNKNTYLSLQNEYYINNFVFQKSQNLFSDLVLRYTFSKRKIDLETNWNNIWNISNLSMVSINAFSYIESNYQLRPSQVIQKIRFSF